MIRGTLLVLGVSVAVAVTAGIGYGLTKKPGDNGHFGHINFPMGDWDWEGSIGDKNQVGTGPVATRDFPWSGQSLKLDAPGDLTYHQGSPVKLTISGPAHLLDRVEVADGVIRLKSGSYNIKNGLTFDLTAPDVDKFDMGGAGEMHLDGYNQPSLDATLSGFGKFDAGEGGKADKLAIDLSGSGKMSFDEFTAKDVTTNLSGFGKLGLTGTADSLDVDLSGSGDADFSDLKVKDAKVDLSGFGEAKLAPTASADIDVSGSGKVQLLTKPPRLSSKVSGFGKIDQP